MTTEKTRTLQEAVASMSESIGMGLYDSIRIQALSAANAACAALAEQNGLVFTPLVLSQVHPEGLSTDGNQDQPGDA